MSNQELFKKSGFFVAISMSVLTVATFVVSYLTPPTSGPLCAGYCYTYPFQGIASRFPRDYYWMYFAIALMLAFAALMAYVHEYAPKGRKVLSRIGLGFGWMSTLVLLADYFVQLTVIQPSVLRNETDGIALISQYNSHGVFIALENLGYLLMSAALLFTGLAFTGRGLNKMIRTLVAAGFLLNIISLAWISIAFGFAQEYRFEIATISINWIVLIAFGILSGLIFRRSAESAAS